MNTVCRMRIDQALAFVVPNRGECLLFYLNSLSNVTGVPHSVAEQ